MRSVVGIDAAWTNQNPGGVALIADQGEGWARIHVASSYRTFCGHRPADPNHPADRLQVLDASLLIDRCVSLIGSSPDLIAVDMPLSLAPIVGRRKADNAVSKVYGARHAGTHTPNAIRPGQVGAHLQKTLLAGGYRLVTNELFLPGLIEVYPHPALIELMSASVRLPYKFSKKRKYWPGLSVEASRVRLGEIWEQILFRLESQISGVRRRLQVPADGATGTKMKAFEDALDAVVCAWVGMCVIEGDAHPYGDEEATIWIPEPRLTSGFSTR